MTTCGIDIIEIDRIKDSIEKYGQKFLETVYTAKEIEYCERKNVQKYQHYAARFAAKEAIYKAVSNNIEIPRTWTDFEIINEESGRPKVNLKINIQALKNIDISLSHCKQYAVANVVADWE